MPFFIALREGVSEKQEKRALVEWSYNLCGALWVHNKL